MLDLTYAIVVGVYQEYGMKFDEANADLAGRLYEAAPTESAQKPRRAPPPDDRSSMAMLQSAIAGSTFKGPRG